MDGEKLLGLKGNKTQIYFLSNHGGKPNARQVGSAQGIDNIEVATNTAKLYQLWTEQSFMDDKLAVLLGVHDLNSEFMVTDLSGNFIKPVMQASQTLAQTGQNGPPIFPAASPAVRLKFTPTADHYLAVAAYDGVPGNPDHPHATRFDHEKGDGLLWIAEAGYAPAMEGTEDRMNKLAIGLWRYTARFDDLVDVDADGNPLRQRSQGAYLLSSYQFLRCREGQTLGGFFRLSFGDGDTKQVEWTYEAGLVGNGWVPTRPDSEIGLGVARAENGDKYMASVSDAADRNEYSLEFYYRDTVYNGITLQPDIQYVVNPGMEPDRKNATVVGLRADIHL